MKHAIRRAVLGIFTAILASFLLVNPATADNHVWEYVVPYMPGTARTAYHNTFIVLSNPQEVSAHLDIKAHVAGSESTVSCGTLDDLAPNEIRRYARNAGSLCVASDESRDSALRIRTAEGVEVTGYLVLSDSRNRALIPLDVNRVEPAPPEGISISSLTLQGLTNRYHRVSVRLRSSSGSWPYRMVACMHVRTTDFTEDGLFNDASRNCSLPNEQLRGWNSPSGQYLNIISHDGNKLSEIASVDYQLAGSGGWGGGTWLQSPLTVRVCIHSIPVDGVLPAPILCRTVSTPAASRSNAQADTETEAPESVTTTGN